MLEKELSGEASGEKCGEMAVKGKLQKTTCGTKDVDRKANARRDFLGHFTFYRT